MAAAAAVAALWLASTASALAAEQTIPVAAAAAGRCRGGAHPGATRVGVATAFGPQLGGGGGGGGQSDLRVADGRRCAGRGRSTPGRGTYSRAVLGIPNLRGITLHPNTLGPIASSHVGHFVGGRTVLPLASPGVSSACLVVGLLWSQSRGRSLAAVAVVALLLVMRWDRTKPYLVAVLLHREPSPRSSLPGCGVIESSFVQGLVTGRTLAWNPAFNIFEHFPWLGYGPDVFSRDFWQLWPPREWEPLHAHGEWPEIAAESGVLGLVALVVVVLIAVVTVLSRQGPNSWPQSASSPVVCTQAAVEVPLGLTYFPISYLLPCLVVAAFAYRGDPGRISPAYSAGEADQDGVSGTRPDGAVSTTGTSGAAPRSGSPAAASPTPTAE